jgi:hypothetical protein
MIWPWSGGRKPDMPSFEKLYGKKGSIISAVDVILGLGLLGKMESLRPEGATGWIDTNYENKARAAVDMLRRNDFVYLHVEAVDECGHLGDLPNKIKAIEDVDGRLAKTFLDEYKKVHRDDLRVMVLPDHPVPGEAAQAHPRSRALHGGRGGRERRPRAGPLHRKGLRGRALPGPGRAPADGSPVRADRRIGAEGAEKAEDAEEEGSEPEPISFFRSP